MSGFFSSEVFMKEKITALYVRVSTENQLTGLESQTRALLSYCESKQIKHYKLYEEFGVSGVKASRPVLDRMILDCEAGLIDSVVVYSFSRFARSSKHLILALELFDKLKIRFVSLTESLDTSTSFGKMVFQVIASVSELERSLLIERVKNGIANARAKGKQIGAKPKPVNLEIYRQLRDKGLSTREIARILKTSQSTVARALKKIESETSFVTESESNCLLTQRKSRWG